MLSDGQGHTVSQEQSQIMLEGSCHPSQVVSTTITDYSSLALEISWDVLLLRFDAA